MSGNAEMIEEMAAAWLIRQDDGQWTADAEAELEAWLDLSAAHEAAYYRLESSYRWADRLAALRAPDPAPRAPRPFERLWQPMAIAAALLVVVLSSILLYRPGPSQSRVAAYETPVGGRSTVALADGSEVELNTDTRMRADVSADRRRVWLDRGEAYFEVAHDADRPFVVLAGDRRITVLGTRFQVRHIGGDVRVDVVDGRVRVERLEGPEAVSTILVRGDTALAAGGSELVADNAEERVARSLSWRDGELVFDGETLAEVTAEFNRYNRKKLVAASGATGEMRISGRFKTSNVDGFASLLRRAYGVEVRDEGERIIISE